MLLYDEYREGKISGTGRGRESKGGVDDGATALSWRRRKGSHASTGQDWEGKGSTDRPEERMLGCAA